MVTSSPYFSKKPRSTAIGSASMSTAATMPTLSFMGSFACASASDGSNSKTQRSIATRRILLSSWLKRLDARNPVRAGDGRQVRSFHSPNFNGVVLCSRHPAVSLESLNVETFRRERQGDQYVHLVRAAGEVHDLLRRGDRQPKLPGKVDDHHR